MDVESLEKLRLLKVALDEGLLSPDEHAEQKRRLLDGLRYDVDAKKSAAKSPSPSTADAATKTTREETSKTSREADDVIHEPAVTATATVTTIPPHLTTSIDCRTTLTSGAGSGNTRTRFAATVPFGPLLAALTVLAVYVTTMFPSAAGGDATELAFIACDAAVPHPPGYPTFTMLASLSSRVFAKFPGFSPAYGSNLASAITGSAAAGVLFAAIHTAVTAGGIFHVHIDGAGEGGGEGSCGARAAAALGSGLVAFSRNVWLNSMQSEVFGLNNMFVALAILFAVRFGARKLEATEAEAEAKAAAEAGDAAAAGDAVVRADERKTDKAKKGNNRGGGGSEAATTPDDGGKKGSVVVVPGALREAVCGAFVCGLAMTNQHTFVLFGTPLALWVLASGRNVGLWRGLQTHTQEKRKNHHYPPHMSHMSHAHNINFIKAKNKNSGLTRLPGTW